MKTLIVGKNSYLSRNFDIDQSTKISHHEVDDFKFDDYEKLILISFPPDYKFKKEKDFLFEKKLFNKFSNKKIVYFSTQKVYPYKLNCDENENLSPDSYYGENKLFIEKLIFETTKKYQIFRISSVFSSNDFAKDSFFYQLKKNWNLDKMINFDISLESIKDFTTRDYLYLILKKMINTENFGIFNIGSSNGISINELLRIIFNNNVPKNIKDKNNLIKSRTLNNKKICQLLNLKSDKIHEDTIKQISNFEL